MGRSDLQSFIKGFDRYAKNVSLAYKKKGSFETSIGGICSIIAFVLLSYMVVISLLELFMDKGKYSTSESIKLAQKDDGTYGPVPVSFNRLFSTFNFQSLSDDITDENMDRYVQGLWLNVDAITFEVS